MLTAFAISKGFAPRDKPYKLSDGGGLHLLTETNGSRSHDPAPETQTPGRTICRGSFHS